jgi:hypothetical protein
VLSGVAFLFAAPMAFRRWRQAGSEDIEPRSHHLGYGGGPGLVSRFTLWQSGERPFLMLAPSWYSFAAAYSLRRIGSCGCRLLAVGFLRAFARCSSRTEILKGSIRDVPPLDAMCLVAAMALWRAPRSAPTPTAVGASARSGVAENLLVAADDSGVCHLAPVTIK